MRLLTLVLVAFSPGASPAQDYVLIGPTAVSPAEADELYRLVEELSDELEIGSTLTLLQSWPTPRVLEHIPVTEEHRRRRERELGPLLQAWDQALRDALVPEGEGAAGPGSEAGSLRLEQTLHELMTQVLPDSDPATRAVCVLAMGDSRSRFDEAAAAFDMDARFFSDGLIGGDPGQLNPYSTRGRETFYQGVDLAVLDLVEAWPSDDFRDAGERAWGRWLAAQDGDLVAFTNSPDTVAERWRSCPLKAGETWADDSALALEAMIELEDVVLRRLEPVAPESEPGAAPSEVMPDERFLERDVVLAIEPPTRLGGPMMNPAGFAGGFNA